MACCSPKSLVKTGQGLLGLCSWGPKSCPQSILLQWPMPPMSLAAARGRPRVRVYDMKDGETTALPRSRIAVAGLFCTLQGVVRLVCRTSEQIRDGSSSRVSCFVNCEQQGQSMFASRVSVSSVFLIFTMLCFGVLQKGSVICGCMSFTRVLSRYRLSWSLRGPNMVRWDETM